MFEEHLNPNLQWKPQLQSEKNPKKGSDQTIQETQKNKAMHQRNKIK